MELKTEITGIEALVAKLEDLQRCLEETAQKVPEEVYNWQAEDMRRRQPFVKAHHSSHVVSASTVIRPRSLKSEQFRKRRRELRRVFGKRRRRRHPRLAIPAARPILRPELWQALVARIETLIANIRWSS